jgi:hypothetical protein
MTEPSHAGEAEIEGLVRAFVDRTLAKQDFTHSAHLRVGLWHALRFPDDVALALLRERICAFNVAVGGVNSAEAGYHETITRFYVAIIRHFLDSADLRRTADDLARELIGRFGDRDLPLHYFSRERLFSVEARLSWLPPDRQALPAPAVAPAAAPAVAPAAGGERPLISR